MAKKTPTKASAAEKLVQASVINLKGSEEYRDWLKAAAKQTRYPAATIVRMALEMWAEKEGVEAPPDK